MENFFLEPTEITPKIFFDVKTRIFEISGESRPENVKEFFEPVLLWIDNYFIENEKNSKIDYTFKISLEYFNSSSAKFLLTILKKIAIYYFSGFNIKVKWYFEKDDEDMKEAGEQMSDMTKMPFEFIEIL